MPIMKRIIGHAAYCCCEGKRVNNLLSNGYGYGKKWKDRAMDKYERNEFFYNLLEDCFAARDKENSNRG